ncbi:ADP-ribosylglycohydrolase family protein [Flavobacterium amniphilum]|uniref:ADP-ribosylglycohydrolase family protein n=1 Tax=Flavobacterium amniphilum TaxID=1834035 RepID=UPI00202AB5A5|nr:ADP-ribosylglycohydrolase family protein [Flavobacterium amniphilum]MCL9805942.1 ADP-ribosylglycohydrolase family protein [Flavobacterium amniphilum]
MKEKVIHSALFGLAVADALGVPVEFRKRSELKSDPVTTMREYGTHRQLKGTWSDDSSLTFCLAESLCDGYNLNDIANNFLLWSKGDFWTAHGEVFDIGISTYHTIENIAKGIDPVLCGGFEESENGNGSLMRILPMAFYFTNEENDGVIYQKIKEVSSITHAHFRSVFACFVYVIFAIELLKDKPLAEVYNRTKKRVSLFLDKKNFNSNETGLFARILNNDISIFPEDEINSSGYVLHSLEAALWCLLTSETYEETVLKAVNLGSDTDTTAAIAGGLAGIYYGFDAIPEEWIQVLARKNAVFNLCDKLEKKLK